ncbi:dapper homolog 3 isoform X2 [Momordica charantia]|uniref:Dapper homolog 3 isoform X2 n=1 Tax=Momordica charantia TaxID=3673 RepID=A0A6J1CSV5_MOMCH|nr:dapper homolog 3 isoform X2 [Momordica charantia]
MGSRDKDSTTHHQPLLSSLVVRASNSDGGGGGVGGTSGGRVGRGSDYEAGYRIHAGSASPTRRRDDHRYISDLDHSGGLTRGRDFGGGRDLGRYRDSSPHYNRRISSGRPFGRGVYGPGLAHGSFRGDRSKNNPNVRPRDGDWYCSDPLCRNLNFARRELCNNCNRSRPGGAGGSPRRSYLGPPSLHSPPRRFAAHPMERSPGRTLAGYRSPPRAWARDGPREIAAGALAPPRYESRYPDHPLRRDRVDYLEDLRGRSKFDRPIPADWALRDHGRDDFLTERKGFERGPPSPPLPLLSQRGRWARDVRERSRSPIRGPVRSPLRVSLRSPLSGGLPPKDFRRDVYVERERDDRRGLGRDRDGGPF